MLSKPQSMFILFTIVVMGSVVLAQRPRSTSQDGDEAPASAASPAPQSVKAKYEGGVFGYNHKMDGTLNFDDTDQRLVFKDSKQKEILFVPYNAITGAYGDTHSVRPAAATVASQVPLYGIPASFIKTKVRYLTLQYSDPDSNVAGVTSFRLENKDILDSVLNGVAGKAGLSRRGEVYVKKRQ